MKPDEPMRLAATNDKGIAQAINNLSNPSRLDSGSSARKGVRVQIPPLALMQAFLGCG